MSLTSIPDEFTLAGAQSAYDPSRSRNTLGRAVEGEEKEDEEDQDSAEDTVFIGPKDAKVIIDLPSLELLKGSTIDYTMELIGSQFKVVGIPGATSSCGCGTSFDIKL
jgi:Fe-S cluster assembly iron-binding protein IscA